MRWSPGYNVWGYGGPVLLPPPVVVVPPAYVVDAEAPPPVQPYDERPPGPVTTLGGDLTLGAGNLQLAGAQLAVEGRRLGVVFAYTAAFAPIAGTDARDTLHLAQARFTYALISGPQARLRLELGGHLAAAPDATFFAPGIGVSAAVHLVGPLGLEGRVYGNAWPYTQVDARAGLSIAAGGVGASVGFRALYLNDNGALGAVNAGNTSDFFYGPCVLLAFAL